MLIKKDGGIRPCEVLATCAYKVLHSIPVTPETDKWKSSITRLFEDKPVWDYRFETLDLSIEAPFSFCSFILVSLWSQLRLSQDMRISKFLVLL